MPTLRLDKSRQAPSAKRQAQVIGITMGDAAGIGPEVILKALDDKEVKKPGARFLIIGDKKVMENNSHKLNIPLAKQANILDLSNINHKFRAGRVDRELGRAAVEYIEKGVQLAQKKKIDALVTAPVNKEAMNLAGYDYSGHTQLLAELTGVKDVAMMFGSSFFNVVLVTTHLPLREVSSLLTKQRVYKTIKLSNDFFKKYFKKKARIGVAGFNPHAGEKGLFGSEEKEIEKAVKKARQEGMKIEGPLPADVLFHQAYSKKYEVVIAMYHDQGLIPFKMLAFDKGVNITLGLPIIRTSPDHGTAFDIAGKGIANPGSMVEAIKMAEFLSQ